MRVIDLMNYVRESYMYYIDEYLSYGNIREYCLCEAAMLEYVGDCLEEFGFNPCLAKWFLEAARLDLRNYRF